MVRWIRLSAIIVMATIVLLGLAVPASAIETTNLAVSVVKPTSAVLMVKADVTSNVVVDYGLSPGVYSSTINSSGLPIHEIALVSLPQASTVYYRVTMTNSSNPADTATLTEKSFKTARPEGDSFGYAVFGDNRPPSDTVIQPAVFGTIVGQMASEGLDLALSLGDIIYGVGSDSTSRALDKYDGFFAVTTQLTERVPLYTVVGNHEVINYANSRTAYQQSFSLPTNNGADAAIYGEEYYSFDNGDTHFIALCTEIPGQAGLITGNQLNWLEQDLAATDKNWIVAYMHRPLFSGLHIFDPWMNLLDPVGQQNKQELHALFLENGVDVVFEGHEHHYQHHEEDGIHYVISGGAGSPLSAPTMSDPGDIFGASTYEHVKVAETATTMTVTAIDYNGATLEEFTLKSLQLDMANTSAYWETFSDYGARYLTTGFTLTNNSSIDISNIEVVGLDATYGVTALTATPFNLPDLASGQNTPFVVQYYVPIGVTSFRALNHVACQDENGTVFEFPDPGATG